MKKTHPVHVTGIDASECTDDSDRKSTGPRLSQSVLTLMVEEGASLDATAYCGWVTTVIKSRRSALCYYLLEIFHEHFGCLYSFSPKVRECDDHLDEGSGPHATLTWPQRSESGRWLCPLLWPASVTPVPDQDEANSILRSAFPSLTTLIQKTF